MAKLKIAFDPDGPWVYESFREVMKSLMWDTENYELFMITMSTETAINDSIALTLGMDTANVFQGILDEADVVTQLDDSGINIYLTPDMEMFTLVNDDSVDTIAILVDSKQDIYNIQPKWFQMLKFWVERLNKNAQEENC